MKRVLLDLDGVLVDMVGGLCRFHNVPNPYGDPKNLGKYELEPLLGIPGPRMWGPLGFEFWKNLQPVPHMRRIVALLEREFSQTNICLLTSPIRTPGCIEGKMAWIREHLPDYSRRFLIGPAKEFCAAPDHLLVDDSPANITKFEAAGGQGFLVPGPWNERYEETPVKALEAWLAS